MNAGKFCRDKIIAVPRTNESPSVVRSPLDLCDNISRYLLSIGETEFARAISSTNRRTSIVRHEVRRGNAFFFPRLRVRGKKLASSVEKHVIAPTLRKNEIYVVV